MDEKISGVVLAGGLGRRMGGGDKGLRLMRGQPLLGWVMGRFAPQVDEILLNANGADPAYAAFGARVLADDIGGFVGPLAGVHAALGTARHPWLASVPCDAPFLPVDLVSRLVAARQAAGAPAAVVTLEGRWQPVFSLLHRDLRQALGDYLQSGGRRVGAWLVDIGALAVPFDDQMAAFRNLNTPEELAAAEAGDAPG